MRNLKKFLALVLAMMMALSLMVTVNAKNVEFTDGETVNDAFIDDLTVLAGMGVIKGYTDGKFQPTSTISRAEMAAIVYRLVTGDASRDPEYKDKSSLYAGYGNFTDVNADDWFSGYVGYCANAGIIVGYPDGKFYPQNNVTGYEALVMLLRAMGYNQPNEFSNRADWREHAASIATTRGMLANVNATVYRGTLSQGAAREVVGEITFQAATKAQVMYTTAFGYQTTGMTGGVLGSTENPSLGWQWYGLTDITGIVVGNQATGEDNTLLGLDVTTQQVSATSYAVSTTPGYKYGTDGANNAATTYLTLSFREETELDMFGHKAQIWYNGKSDAGSATIYADGSGTVAATWRDDFTETYAVLDKAELVKTVFADDLHTEQATASKTSVYSAAVAAGFHKSSAPAYESDVYSRIAAITNAGTPASAVATQSKVGMYTVISNNDSKKADLVIPLNLEVAKITQVNTTIKDGEYIFLGDGASKFGVGLDTPATPDGKILMDNLAPGSDKTLGDIVTASQIIGTTDVKANLAAADYLYDTRKLVKSVTGTVATYTLAGTDVVEVTLTNNDSYKLSGITGAAINTAPAQWGFDTATHLIDNALTTLTSTNTQAGVSYTFYLDALDRFIGVSAPNTNTFLYGTYADYSMGGLGTAEMNYVISGFNWDGTLVSNHPLLSYTYYDTGSTSWKTDKGSTGYNGLSVSRKDLGQAGANGNEIKAGFDTAYMIDTDGNLTTRGINGHQFFGWWDASLQTPAASNTWTITAQDATNGFARVKNSPAVPTDNSTDVDYLLTESTKFVVVSGIGINATAKIYNGLKDLVGTGSSATITFTEDATDGTGNEVWFQTADQKYGNVDTSKNNTIETVILSDKNLVQYGAQSLFFAAPSAAATAVKLAGCDDANVKQYKLYSNGVANTYWVKDDAGVAATGTATTGDFYTLIQIDTISGQPIYKATKVTDTANSNRVGSTYNYITVNDVGTAEITFDPSGTPVPHVFKVEGATVAEAYGANDISTLFPDGTNITDVSTLNHAVAMGKPGASGDLYTVSVAIVYSGINVSCIYVTNITAAP